MSAVILQGAQRRRHPPRRRAERRHRGAALPPMIARPTPCLPATTDDPHERQKAPPQPGLVRPPGQDGLLLSLLAEEPRLPAGPVRRPAGDRHLQHLVRADAVQLAFPDHRGARPLGRPGGGRLPARVPGHVARRDHAAADRDAVPQPRVDGRRGIDPRQPARRRGAADGLRQDHAGAADGRRERRPADDRDLRRPDAARRSTRAGTSARAPTRSR